MSSDPSIEESLYDRACRVIPGGVSSPVRAFKAVGGRPIFIARGEGATVVDESGRRYLDFVGSWGPLILGHARGEIVAAIQRAAADGTSFGAPCRAEVELAEHLVGAYPGLEQVRFVSSGTEAVMSAVRLARGATGRDLIVKFAGCYHGHADHLLVEAGSGLVTAGRPSSAGVPQAFAELTRVLPLDDVPALEALFAAEGGRIAAAIIEPVPANNGLLLQHRAFLERLRSLTKANGALLIFDEVISGFRVARGGAAAHYGITPDLAAFGKIIGGGMPVGAFGGAREIMRWIAPLGPVYQAGTLSGNPVAMAAGLTALRLLDRERAWERLEEAGAAFEDMVSPALGGARRPVRLVRLGSLLWFSLQAGEAPRAAHMIDPHAADRFRFLFHGLLERGIAIAPSAYEVAFLSLAHRREDLRRFADALGDVLANEEDGVA